MALSDARIRGLKPQDKPYKVADDRGLFLLVNPNGSKLWRVKFRIDGLDAKGRHKKVEKLLSLGAFPDVPLKRARLLRDEAREAHAAGLDPALEKQKAKAAARISAENSFSRVAKMLLEKQEREGLAEATIIKRRRSSRGDGSSNSSSPFWESAPSPKFSRWRYCLPCVPSRRRAGMKAPSVR